MSSELPEGFIPQRDLDNLTMEIDIQPGKWDGAFEGKLIGTSGLGSCLGIILYDTKNKHAIVGHFNDTGEDSYTEMLESLRPQITNLESMKVFLGGTSAIDDEADTQEIEKIRESVVNDVNTLGVPIKNQYIQWAKNSNLEYDVVTDMIIDTSTGEATYEERIYKDGQVADMSVTSVDL